MKAWWKWWNIVTR